MGDGPVLTRREWFTLLAIGSVHFCSAICVSLQAPFYPKEAEDKGATATEYGLVFGIFELVAFISCPIFGKYINKMGAKMTLNIGICVAGIGSMVFGLLDLIDSHTWFITFSFMVRIVESLGASAALTASFSITAVVFPGSVATTFATLEVFYGLGYIVGPTIGGYFFQLGGFICPFLVTGCLLLLDGVFIFFALPVIDHSDSKNSPPVKIFSVLKLPPVLLDSFSVTVAAISVGYLSATLEPHVRQFDLSPVATGSMFIISGGFYAITAPFVGKLCDTRVDPKKMILLGACLVLVSFTLVGPFPYIPIDTTLWMCCVGLVVHGLGFACILVPAFIDAIRSAVSYGLPDDITTYGIVSGLWASSFALGAFVGPSVAGLLFDTVGFRKGTLFVIAVILILVVATITFICVEKRQRLKHLTSCDNNGCVNLCASWSGSYEEEANTAGNCSTDPDKHRRWTNTNKWNGYGSIGRDLSDLEKHNYKVAQLEANNLVLGTLYC